MKTAKSPALTWDELADIYDRENAGRRARTLPMKTIFAWAEDQPKRFHVCPKEGTIHQTNRQ